MTLPRETIERNHLDTLLARQKVAIADDPDEPPTDDRGRSTGSTPHELLQKSVSGYYECLRSYLVSSPEGRRYYAGQPPKEPGDLGYGVLQRWVKKREVPTDDLPTPPEDVLDEREFYGTAIEEKLPDRETLLPPVKIEPADGQRIVHARIAEHKTGLYHLDNLYDNRETVEIEDDDTKFGHGSFFVDRDDDEDTTEKRVVLEPLEFLMNAARELDRAASELDLLAETRESDMKPYMRDFDSSGSETSAAVSQAEISGSPDMT